MATTTVVAFHLSCSCARRVCVVGSAPELGGSGIPLTRHGSHWKGQVAITSAEDTIEYCFLADWGHGAERDAGGPQRLRLWAPSRLALPAAITVFAQVEPSHPRGYDIDVSGEARVYHRSEVGPLAAYTHRRVCDLPVTDTVVEGRPASAFLLPSVLRVYQTETRESLDPSYWLPFPAMQVSRDGSCVGWFKPAFLSRVRYWSLVSHPHVLIVLGVCYDEDTQCAWLLTEVVRDSYAGYLAVLRGRVSLAMLQGHYRDVLSALQAMHTYEQCYAGVGGAVVCEDGGQVRVKMSCLRAVSTWRELPFPIRKDTAHRAAAGVFLFAFATFLCVKGQRCIRPAPNFLLFSLRDEMSWRFHRDPHNNALLSELLPGSLPGLLSAPSAEKLNASGALSDEAAVREAELSGSPILPITNALLPYISWQPAKDAWSCVSPLHEFRPCAQTWAMAQVLMADDIVTSGNGALPGQPRSEHLPWPERLRREVLFPSFHAPCSAEAVGALLRLCESRIAQFTCALEHLCVLEGACSGAVLLAAEDEEEEGQTAALARVVQECVRTARQAASMKEKELEAAAEAARVHSEQLLCVAVMCEDTQTGDASSDAIAHAMLPLRYTPPGPPAGVYVECCPLAPLTAVVDAAGRWRQRPGVDRVEGTGLRVCWQGWDEDARYNNRVRVVWTGASAGVFGQVALAVEGGVCTGVCIVDVGVVEASYVVPDPEVTEVTLRLRVCGEEVCGSPFRVHREYNFAPSRVITLAGCVATRRCRLVLWPSQNLVGVVNPRFPLAVTVYRAADGGFVCGVGPRGAIAACVTTSGTVLLLQDHPARVCEYRLSGECVREFGLAPHGVLSPIDIHCNGVYVAVATLAGALILSYASGAVVGVCAPSLPCASVRLHPFLPLVLVCHVFGVPAEMWDVAGTKGAPFPLPTGMCWPFACAFTAAGWVVVVERGMPYRTSVQGAQTAHVLTDEGHPLQTLSLSGWRCVSLAAAGRGLCLLADTPPGPKSTRYRHSSTLLFFT